MPLILDKIEGLTAEQILAINTANEGYQSPAEVQGLKDSRDVLLGEKKTAQEAADAAAAEAKAAALKVATAKGDTDAINASWQEKFDAQGAKLDAMVKSNETGAVTAIVNDLAGKLADGTDADLLKPFIEKRLRYDTDGVKVTDANGQLTISTLADLEAEFRGNAMFSNIIVASRANGGGATNASGAGGAGVVAKQDGTPTEQAVHMAGKVPALADLPLG